MNARTIGIGVGIAALLGGGAAVYYANKSSAATPATPPPATPTAPIPITQGHRYQVTLTFGAAPGAAALQTNVLPNIQVGLNAVAPNEYSFVSAIVPKDNQVVYVVDAIGGAAGSVHQESPQTFYADLNAAQAGGLSVQVQDMGLSPAAPGGSTSAAAPAPTSSSSTAAASPAGTTATSSPATTSSSGGPATAAPAGSPAGPTTLVSDPTLVTIAQTALGKLIASGVISAPGVTVTANGNPSDPSTAAAIQAFQTNESQPVTGQLSVLVLSMLVVADLTGLLQDPAITDASLSLGAQLALAQCIAQGSIPNIDYGKSQANGNPTDAAFVGALSSVAAQFNASAGSTVWTAALDLYMLAALFVTAYLKPLVAGSSGVTPIMPGQAVTTTSEVQLVQTMFSALPTTPPSGSPSFAGLVANGNPSDPKTVAAVTALQSMQSGIQHRTTPGVLDYLTMAVVIGDALGAIYASQVASPGTLTGPAITDPAVVAGCQEAIATLLTNGRLGTVSGASWTWSQVDANASNAQFVATLKLVVGVINARIKGSAGYQFPVNGTLDYYLFAALFVLAYI